MRILQGLGFAMIGSLGFADLRAAAPHPTVLTVLYRDSYQPVVRVIGTDPVILIEGKEKRIRTEPSYLPGRINHYANGNVEVQGASIGSLPIQMSVGSPPPPQYVATFRLHGGYSDFRATLRSETGLSGAFIAVVIYSRSALKDTTTFPSTEIVVWALPDLPANKTVPVSFTSKAFAEREDQAFFVQVFDREGRELMSNVASEGWPYYTAMERIQLQDTLRKLKPSLVGKDLEAQPVLTIHPLLPKQVPAPKEPVFAQLTISVDGTVTDVQVEPTSPASVGEAVRAALAGWLFIPRIRRGEPVACTVRIPITF